MDSNPDVLVLSFVGYILLGMVAAWAAFLQRVSQATVRGIGTVVGHEKRGSTYHTQIAYEHPLTGEMHRITSKLGGSTQLYEKGEELPLLIHPIKGEKAFILGRYQLYVMPGIAFALGVIFVLLPSFAS